MLCFVAAAVLTAASTSWSTTPLAGAQTDPSTTPLTDPSTSPSMAPSTAPSTTTGAAPEAPAEPSIDVLQADADQVRAALADTAAKRTAAQGELAQARAAAETAMAESAKAEAAARAAQKQAEALDRDVKAAAVSAFVGTGVDVPLGALTSDNAEDASWQSAVLQYQADELTELLAEQRAAHDALEAERRERDEVAQAAEAAERQSAAKVDALVQLENDQATLVAQVDQRLDAALSEAAALAAIDAEAAARLASQEQELRNAAAALSVTAPPEDTPVTGTPVVRTAPTTTTIPRTTTIPPAPKPPTTSAPTTTVPTSTVPTPTAVDTVNVGGFIVARSISGPFGSMLEAASAAGLQLGGSAYRDINVQIDLRRQHCGTTDYDIWLRPASQCSPPTAIPGRSMHEKGLAIDFTCSGPLIGSRSSPCFTWLAANAAQFGFYNLPSEPWHWSTNGN